MYRVDRSIPLVYENERNDKRKKNKKKESRERKRTNKCWDEFQQGPEDFVAIILQPMIHLWIPNGSNQSSKSIRSGGNVNYVSKGRNVLIRSGLSDLHRGTGGKWS